MEEKLRVQYTTRNMCKPSSCIYMLYSDLSRGESRTAVASPAESPAEYCVNLGPPSPSAPAISLLIKNPLSGTIYEMGDAHVQTRIIEVYVHRIEAFNQW